MSSFSRRSPALITAAVVLGFAAPAAALNVHAVYRTACTRDLGVILKVEKRTIELLSLSGTISTIPRHEIVSLAYYPVSQLPIAKLPADPKVKPLRVETLFGGEIVSLARGWPIDYSETKIAFLLENGKDLVIERDSIWSLEFEPPSAVEGAPQGGADRFEFVHPQTAGFCADPAGDVERRRIFAQQILNDRIVIKRELDRLEEGYEEVLDYLGDQKFYPLPHLYENKTVLGLWVSFLSRHGASDSRTNNYTPTLIDELSLGPFRYQHIFLSGAAPNQMLIHTEAQSQIYYRFKAAYFHASVFVDPNLVLVGTKYGWRPEDLEGENLDDRINEWLGIEFGFDFGPVALELYPAMVAQSALKTSMFFDEANDHNLWRAGARFTQRLWMIQAFAGVAITDDTIDDEGVSGTGTYDYRYARLNLEIEPWHRVEVLASVVARTLDFELRGFGAPQLDYDSLDIQSSLQGIFAVSHRFDVGANAIFEYQSRKESGSSRRRRLLPGIGLFTSFSF